MPRKNRQIKHGRLVIINNCVLKRKFRNEREAQKAADYQMLINMNLELSVYKCDFCGMWHLTRNK